MKDFILSYGIAKNTKGVLYFNEEHQCYTINSVPLRSSQDECIADFTK